MLWAYQTVKKPPANAGDVKDAGSIPGLGRSPGGGSGNPLQYSSLENPTDRGAWWATTHRFAKSQTQRKQLSPHTKLLSNVLVSAEQWRESATCINISPPFHPAPIPPVSVTEVSSLCMYLLPTSYPSAHGRVYISTPLLRPCISNMLQELQWISWLTEGPLSLSELKKPPGMNVLSPIFHLGDPHKSQEMSVKVMI